ncbi:guanine nucleotide-binding protein subunit gamma 1 [Canna indica]|uniref:Guanine nucleotide-binding protein subunit gamma 1 n=1 Tax=Canna indica TaxID=4628 RepID=A0AAQ3KF59_9LILI|nr:guanine nucleotide-binding protein subunit gamma 1 [Canna indica]
MLVNEAQAAAASDQQSPLLSDTRGKHRILAEVKRLEQEARSLEEELEELDRMEKVSSTLEEFLLQVESKPDPLLPETRGPTNSSWEIWFEGPQEMQGCRCWIL